jgi:hypothetical protein
MSPLVSLFLSLTLIYFSYLNISYELVLSCMGDLFTCSSSVLHLEAPVLDEEGLSILLTGDLFMFSSFFHELKARVLHEHDPLIQWNIRRRTRNYLYD